MPYKDKEADILKNVAEVIVDDIWQKEVILKIIPEMDGLLVDVGADIDREIIERGQKLKIIVEYGVGVDNIDIEAASEKGIYVCNLPHVFTVEVAEFAAGLILALSKQIIRQDSDIKRKGEWDSSGYSPLLLAGKTIGFIGYGRIARKLKEILSGFRLKSIAYDPYLDEDMILKDDTVKTGLEDLLRQSDIVSIHVPLNKETRDLIDRERLSLMKKNAILVNVSRGAVVNEDHLYDALRSGKISGAALDVLSAESSVQDNPLRKLDNIILTPHIAWKSEFSIENAEIQAATKVRDFLKGKEVEGCVNL
jgi:D-3-phosphoglycerate dehydrogenase / 2-oxoglutarate reductase